MAKSITFEHLRPGTQSRTAVGDRDVIAAGAGAGAAANPPNPPLTTIAAAAASARKSRGIIDVHPV
jgi:hypothetical protein